MWLVRQEISRGQRSLSEGALSITPNARALSLQLAGLLKAPRFLQRPAFFRDDDALRCTPSNQHSRTHPVPDDGHDGRQGREGLGRDNVDVDRRGGDLVRPDRHQVREVRALFVLAFT